jgi:predicted RNA-binding Zn-ribbon protein involved in translation (DUF1610 family)
MPALYSLIVDTISRKSYGSREKKACFIPPDCGHYYSIRKSCGSREENVGFTPPDCGHYFAGNLAGAGKRMPAFYPLIVDTISRKPCEHREEKVGFTPLIVDTI